MRLDTTKVPRAVLCQPPLYLLPFFPTSPQLQMCWTQLPRIREDSFRLALP